MTTGHCRHLQENLKCTRLLACGFATQTVRMRFGGSENAELLFDEDDYEST